MKRLFLIIFLVTFFLLFKNKVRLVPLTRPIPAPIVTPMPTPRIYTPIETYAPPKVKPAGSYTLLFVGDSMTGALGENFEILRKYLGSYYPGKDFGLFNYGFGSTNIYSVKQRLHSDSHYLGKTVPPILGRYYDVIILESFGYNPLSEYSIEEGIARQTKMLDQITVQLYEAKPESMIIFMATIAPSKQKYALGVIDSSPEERADQAEERIAYIKNHIDYAQKHNFPLINVYEKSLDKNGNAILRYISPDNYIHPSPEGVRFISQQIADFLNQNDILPK